MAEQKLKPIAETPTPTDGNRMRSRPIWDIGGAVSPFYAIPDDNKYKLYKHLLNTIPPLRRAITNYTYLVGTLEVTADDPLKTEIEDFLNGIKVDYLSQGYSTARNVRIRSRLAFGKCVSEMVPNNAGNDLYSIVNLDPETITLRENPDSPAVLDVYQQQSGNWNGVLLDPFWVDVSLNDPETDPHGVSILKSIPFVSEFLLTLEECQKKVWERFGVPTYHNNWRPPEGWNDPEGTKATAIMTAIQSSFTEAMEARQRGSVKDFFSSGEVTVDVIGAAEDELNFEIPYKSLMEQIVSATGQPPWMLGFSWSTTERLSTNQADLLTSTVNGIATEELHFSRRLVQRWLDLTGRQGEFELVFNPVSLHDAVETARADAIAAQAMSTREATGRKLWEAGIIGQPQYAEQVLGEEFDGVIATPMDAPPAAPAPTGGFNPIGFSAAHKDIHPDGCNCVTMALKDAHTSIGKGEKPADKRVQKAIDAMYADIIAAWRTFKDETFNIFKLKQKNFAADDTFGFTKEQLKLYDAAADIFVKKMVGNDLYKESFLDPETPDGIIQQWDRFGYAIGINRAAETTGIDASHLIPSRDAESVKQMLSNGFDRLSESGKLRIGDQINGGIRDVIASYADRGMNPIDVAEELEKQFSGYEAYEWERLARTEIAFANNNGMIDEYRAEGYDTSAAEQDPPPWHPNCLCSLAYDPEARRIVYMISEQACDLCQAYAN